MSGGGGHLKDEGMKQQVVLAGATAGLVSRFCIAPLDVVKIRLQLQVAPISKPRTNSLSAPRYNGTLRTFQTIVKEEGLSALWKGNIPAELLYVLYGGAQFSAYRYTTTILQASPYPLPNTAQSFIAGAAAGGVATTVTYPLDLLRTRFAAQGTRRIYPSLLASIRDIYRYEGFRGFFQGVGASVGQIVPFMGLFFTGYETLRVPLSKLDLPFGMADATAGIVASVMAKTGVFPLDLVRKRLQVQGPTRSRYSHGDMPVYKGVYRTMRSIVRHEGKRGLYRGLTVSLFKAAPASAITMWTYERALKVLEKMEVGVS